MRSRATLQVARAPRTLKDRDTRQAGQSLVESCLVIMVISVIFCGVIQVARVFAAREVLHHAAARGARAKTVGFNMWMVDKCVRAAAIPNAGKLIEPSFINDDVALQSQINSLKPGPFWDWALKAVPPSLQYAIEEPRIPSYLGSDNPAQAEFILDYENWDTVHYSAGQVWIPVDTAGTLAPMVHVGVQQDFPLTMPLRKIFYSDDYVHLKANAYLEGHYPIYVDDMYW